MLLYVHRDRTDFYGRGAQDGHLDFHTVPELWGTKFDVVLCPQRLYCIQTIRDGEPRTATSAFTQLLSSDIPSNGGEVPNSTLRFSSNGLVSFKKLNFIMLNSSFPPKYVRTPRALWKRAGFSRQTAGSETTWTISKQSFPCLASAWTETISIDGSNRRYSLELADS